MSDTQRERFRQRDAEQKRYRRAQHREEESRAQREQDRLQIEVPYLRPVTLSGNRSGSAILRLAQSNDRNRRKKNVKLSVRLTQSNTGFDDRSLPKKRGRSYWRRICIGMRSDVRNERETSDKKSSRGYGLGANVHVTDTL
ncbi:hypothetical protein PC129_g19873 [Phytophthora cactorum]|uniref:Uncharacterized protein n=1 Tax=Phytophthora cactorum TaxID=29920 RepID=A0A329RN11_9STRA|nr:hypothetical protein Pcac1_g27868 [Phytophthora cactorum]KAG2800343.1 hypothetical protein PC112_g20527 [Phytophthora cactorum]KAG2800698.1 hypothetical protein PC111_g19867 [Phytophthora cactorum]KAG2834283.1 hypothetical protein PC113_g20420 [Phytophthora cactorum]KAG2878192.1 hypothetical protein PC114_g23252 [Phytophthora cactorum]